MGMGLETAFGNDALYNLLAQRRAQKLAEQLQAQQRSDKLTQQGTENNFRQQQLDIQRQALEPKLNPPEKPMALSAGQSLVDPATGRIIAALPEKSPTPKGPLNVAPGGTVFDPEKGVLYTSPFKPQAPQSEPLVQVMGADGVPVYMPRSQAAGQPAAQAPRAVTGAERQTLAYFNRMLDAERNARAVENDASGWDIGVSNSSMVPGFLENFLKSDAGQKYTQAQRMFTEARLRKESGAAIPENEFANDRRMNFRQPGEKPDSIAQKRRSRLETIRGTGNAAGRALQEYYGKDATLDSLLREFADQQGGTIRARDPQGKLHEAPAGTPLPQGWVLEK